RLHGMPRAKCALGFGKRTTSGKAGRAAIVHVVRADALELARYLQQGTVSAPLQFALAAECKAGGKRFSLQFRERHETVHVHCIACLRPGSCHFPQGGGTESAEQDARSRPRDAKEFGEYAAGLCTP